MDIKTPPHLAYVAELPCETLMSAKQAISDELQGSVATSLRCGGVVNIQIKKGLLLSLWVKKKLKSVNIRQSYKQERGCLMHIARPANTLGMEESTRDNHERKSEGCPNNTVDRSREGASGMRERSRGSRAFPP